LKSHHDITYATEIRSFLNMDLEWSAESVCLSERSYISTFLNEFGYDTILPKRLPAPRGLVIEPPSDEEKKQTVDAQRVHEFASRVGTLSYLGTHTRHDCCYVVNNLARFMHTPVGRVTDLLPDVFAYVTHTKHCGLRYGEMWEMDWNLLAFVMHAGFRKYRVFKPAKEIPPGKRCLKSKDVFAYKYDALGEISKCKVRLVACGYAQSLYGEYFLTNADVAETRSFRLVLCLGVCCGGVFFQGDVVSAFLQSELDEEIYMRTPEGYGPITYLQLLRPLYGLKQAGRQWRTTFDGVLRSCGMTNCEREPGVYYRLEQGSVACMLAVHVDDFFGWSVSGE
jgi:hypothetical protein